jgi:hypothetical protein
MGFIGVLAPFAKFRKATISFVIGHFTRVFMEQPVYHGMDLLPKYPKKIIFG